MEESQLLMGGLSSTDAEIWLMRSNEEKYRRIPVDLHSERREFFKPKMWSSESDLANLDNVRQCLAALRATPQLVADDLVKKCMQCLQEACWSEGQETLIRDVVSSLGLKVSPELADKLDNVMYEERMIKRMVSLIKNKNEGREKREIALGYIMNILKGEKGKDAAEICKQVLFQEFKPSIRSGHLLSRLGFKSCIHFGHLLSACLGIKLVQKMEDEKDISFEEKLIDVMFSLFRDKKATTESWIMAKTYITEILEGGNISQNVVKAWEEKVINGMFSLIKDDHGDRESRYMAKKYIIKILKGKDVSQNAVKVCKQVLLQEFKASIRSRNISAVRSLSSFILSIKSCDAYLSNGLCWDREVEKAAFIAFCEDPEFIKYLNERYKSLRSVGSAEDVCTIINSFMEAISRKEITPTESQISSFLTTWLPMMAKLCSNVRSVEMLDKAALVLAERLPQHDRIRIRDVWAEAYTKHGISMKRVLTLST